MKRLSRQEKIDQCTVNLINEMFKIAGHDVSFEDIKNRKDDWYVQWTMTSEQNQEWIQFGVDLIRKTLKMNKKLAEREMQWFNLNYGLKIEEKI
jgi:hypothetical protein